MKCRHMICKQTCTPKGVNENRAQRKTQKLMAIYKFLNLYLSAIKVKHFNNYNYSYKHTFKVAEYNFTAETFPTMYILIN